MIKLTIEFKPVIYAQARVEMRQYLLGLLIVFFTTLNTPVLAEWTEFAESDIGTIFYIDSERVRKLDGYVYFWILENYLKPNEHGDFSTKIYYEGDCRNFRTAGLSYHFYKQPMGRDDSSSFNPKDKTWHYPPPNSVRERMLQLVCDK